VETPVSRDDYNKGHALWLGNVDRGERAGWQRFERRVIDRRRHGERNYQNDDGSYDQAPHTERLYSRRALVL
jgi:hypothetical protein